MTKHSGPALAQRDGLTVVDCRACGYAHLDPLPAAADLAAYYAGEFWQRDKAGWRARYDAQAEWDAARFTDWLTVAGAGLTVFPPSLLDVGCGYGNFAATAASNGWYVAGIEPSAEAAEFAAGRGVPVLRGTWEDFAATYRDRSEWETHSVVSALWLLEHLPDPAAFLGWTRRHGQRLILAVPNEFTRDQARANRVAGVRDWFVHKTHLNYFTPASIGNLLGQTAWRVTDTLATWPMERFILRGQDYTTSAELGDRLHAQVRAADLRKSRPARIEFYRRMARQGAGRDLVIFAEAA